MAYLYLMRHGQTELNVAGLVQGRCDSPLTELGREQAHAAGRWLAGCGATFTRIVSSPLGRAKQTAGIVREEIARASSLEPPFVELDDGIIERSFGPFEQGPASAVPHDLWDPGEALVPYGGEGSRAVRARMVETLTALMEQAQGGNVLAVSHGSATRQFKFAWADRARCPQDVPIGNCCIMVYEYDPQNRSFSNTQIVNQ